MKGLVIHRLLVATFATLVIQTAQAVDYENKEVNAIQTSGGTVDDCFYFQLQGVHPGPHAWFAVQRNTQIGWKETIAVILAAKLTGTLVSVRTTTLGCGGYAMANIVWSGP